MDSSPKHYVAQYAFGLTWTILSFSLQNLDGYTELQKLRQKNRTLAPEFNWAKKWLQIKPSDLETSQTIATVRNKYYKH